MKTRILTLIMSLFVATMAFAYNAEIDGIYYNLDETNKTAEVTSGEYYSYAVDIIIPEKVNYSGVEYTVTLIGEYAFYYCSSLASITIPNSVTSIGRSAFEECSSLTSITIGNSVTSIGNRAFQGTVSLAAVHISDLAAWCNIEFDAKDSNPLYNAGNLYLNNTKVTDLVIPEGVDSIKDYVFYNCESLTSITIPNSVTSIGGGAFYNCESLTSIQWNAKKCNDFEYGSPFYYNSLYHIKSFTFGDNVEYIPADLCSRMSGLTSITIPNSVTSIGESAFSSCSSLTSITIPNSVTSIGDETFYNCDDLTSITIPNSITSIGNEVFSGCDRLTSIIMGNAVPPTLGSDAIRKKTLIYIPDGAKSVYQSVWGSDYLYLNNETTLSINVETPGTLVDLILDAGLRPINVVKLIVEGTLNDDDFKCIQETMTSLAVLDMSKVTNTSGVNFCESGTLVDIFLPENLIFIDDEAFAYCSRLTSIKIPQSVTTIGNEAFCNNFALKNVYISDIAAWCNIEFESYSSNPFWYAETLYLNNVEVTNLVIPEDVVSIRNYAFYGSSFLTSIKIPNSVTSIGDEAFYRCLSLTSITIGNSVTSIGESAFEDCSSLTSIEIPNSVTSIGESAFKDCSSLTSIEIPNSVTSIGESAFKDCSSLTSITIGNSVTSIGESAFYNCEGLISITCLGLTPPEASDLGVNTTTCILTVPKVAYKDYLKHAYWGQFLNVETIDVDYKKLTITVNNEDCGIVTGSGTYDYGTEVTIEAIANEGYHFVQWSDGNTENPRTIVVTEDIELRAEFELDGTPVDNVDESSVMIYVQNGVIYVEGAEADYHVLDAAGRLIYSGRDAQLSLPRGVYVVVVGDAVEKIVL